MRETSVREQVLNAMSGEVLDEVELRLVVGGAAPSEIFPPGCCGTGSQVRSFAGAGE